MTPNEFREQMAMLKEPPAGSHPPLWDYWRHDVWSKAQSQSAYSFMGWPSIFHTMLQNHWPEVVECEYQAIKSERPNMLLACVIPNLFYPYDRHGNTPYSRNLLHQAYHLLQWEKATGHRVANLKSIVEFGGGYGAMALVARNLGFKGVYEIIDLPEFILLQEFFLSNTVGEGDEHFFSNTLKLNSGYESVEVDLFIAGYSLSEVDNDKRDVSFRGTKAGSYLLWYSNKFEEYDNIDYFQNQLPARLGGQWRHWQATHMPPETWYSIGLGKHEH